MQMDEERRHADQYKEQLEKAQSAKKSTQRELTDMEEEVSRLNAQRRRVQRELDESTESLEASQREISALKSRLRVTDKTAPRQAPLTSTRTTRSSFLTTTRYGNGSDDETASVDESASVGSGGAGDDTKTSEA